MGAAGGLPSGGASCLRESCPGWGNLPPPPAVAEVGGRGPLPAPRACVRNVWGRALSIPQRPVLGAGGWGPLPAFPSHGGCRRGEPSTTPQRTFLQAAFARCGGGTKAPQGGAGATCLRVGYRGLGTLPPRTHRPWCRRPWRAFRFRWARGYPTAHVLASWRCVLWGRHKGARRGAPLASVRCVWNGALHLPRQPVLELC